MLEPRTRRPKTSPSKLTDEVKKQAIDVRAALESFGLDHGPISVHDKMRAMGLTVVPSTAALARILREAGVARSEPKKKPRSAWRRFVHQAWDATPVAEAPRPSRERLIRPRVHGPPAARVR